MTFTSKIESLLSENKFREVIDEFMKFLSDCPVSNTDAKADANSLKGQVIVLAGRYNSLNEKMNLRTISEETANTEKSALQYSFFQIVSQIPNYAALNDYMQERDEETEWKDAKAKNTIEAYNSYFTKYPNGKYKSDTLKFIAELEEIKQSQEEQIKKMAQDEKERRDRDRERMESEEKYKKQEWAEKQKTTQASQPVKAYRQPGQAGNANTDTGSENKTSFIKSTKGLLIMGAALLVVIILIVTLSRSGTSKDASTIATDSSAVQGSDSASANSAANLSANDIINNLDLHCMVNPNQQSGDNVSYIFHLEGDSKYLDMVSEADYSIGESNKSSTDVTNKFEIQVYLDPNNKPEKIQIHIVSKGDTTSDDVSKVVIYDN